MGAWAHAFTVRVRAAGFARAPERERGRDRERGRERETGAGKL